MHLAKFIYDLSGKPSPKANELDDELDYLLLQKGLGEPSCLHEFDDRNVSDQIEKLDCEVITHWIHRKFKPALLLLLIESDENVSFVKEELSRLRGRQNFIDKFFRFVFIERHAKQRLRELCFEGSCKFDLMHEVKNLQRTLTFISSHFQLISPSNITLKDTEKYTLADITLFNYLRRILLGEFQTHGLRSHIKNCDPLLQFMLRYKSKNPHVVYEDPFEDEEKKKSLMADLTKPAIVAAGVIIFFLWRRR